MENVQRERALIQENGRDMLNELVDDLRDNEKLFMELRKGSF